MGNSKGIVKSSKMLQSAAKNLLYLTFYFKYIIINIYKNKRRNLND